MQPYRRRRQTIGPAGHDLPQSRAPNRKDIDATFNKADANGDGRLDRQEAAQFAPVLQRFDALDADHDGFVTRAELARVAGF